ncbi:MAG: hypothetical protein AAGI63_09745 [Planctomycetota bacterium]
MIRTFVALILFASLLPATFLRAESVPLGPMPLPNATGMAVTVSLESVGGNGYHPVHLTFRPRGKQFTRDRRLSVVIGPENSQKTDLDFNFRADILVPEAAAIYEKTLLVPHYYAWDSLTISLAEEGERLKGGTRTFPIATKLRVRTTDQLVSVGILLPKDEKTQDAEWKKFPDVRGLMAVLGRGPMPEGKDAEVKRLDHQAALKLAKSVQPASVQFRVLEEGKLSDKWLAYSQLDLILIPAPVLERIISEQPAEAEAIKKWLAIGGNLWVYASDVAPVSWVAKSDFATPPTGRVVRKEALADLLFLREKNDTSPLNYQNWGVIKESQIYGYRSDQTFKTRRTVFNDLKKSMHPLAELQSPAELVGRVQYASYGLGTVVTIKEEDPFPGSFQLWLSLTAMEPSQVLAWQERMGIDVPAGNDNYWMWLIPSVGQPPVKAFVVLNTLFALLMGPFCYFYFRRRERLYLLYFAAPAMAFVMTIGLFVFALVSDGVQTQIRSRQLTWIDPVHEQHVQQSRQTYFAVMGRERGIHLDDEVAVYPVQHSPTYTYNYYDRRQSDTRSDGEVIDGPDERIHRGSFFPSRSQVQYLMTNAKQDAGCVRFNSQAGTIENELDFALKQVIVCDQQGNVWMVSDLPAGESATAERADQEAVERLLGPDVRPTLGEVPMLRKSYYRVVGMVAVGVQVSLLEGLLDEWSIKMPKGTFLATTELEEERLGVEEALTLDSVHVVMGQLP